MDVPLAACQNLADRCLRHLEEARHGAVGAFETVRALDELTADVTTAAARMYEEAFASKGALSEQLMAELIASESMAMDIADAKLAVLDVCYDGMDVVCKDLDKKIRVMEAILRAQGAS